MDVRAIPTRAVSHFGMMDTHSLPPHSLQLRDEAAMSRDPPSCVPWAAAGIEVARYSEVSGNHAHVRSATSCPPPRCTERRGGTVFACSVCIRDAKEAFSVRPRFPEHFQYMVLDVQDSEEQNLIRLFPQ